MTTTTVLPNLAPTPTTVALRALMGVRWRELAGRKGWLAAPLLGAWVLLSSALMWWVVTMGGSHLAVAAASSMFFVWAFAPLVGAGSTEVVSPERLVAFPIDPRALRWANWLAALTDLPVLAGSGVVLGAGWGLGGPAGLVTAAVLIVLGTAVGQLTATGANWLVVHRGWRGTTIVGGMALGAVAALGATTKLGTVVDALPGAWAVDAFNAAGSGSWGLWLAWTAALVGAGVLAVVAVQSFPTVPTSRGVTQTRAVARRYAIPTRPALAAAWMVAANILRAPTTRFVLIGTQIAPVFVVVASSIGANFGAANTIVAAAAVAVLVTLGVNMFSFAGPGMATVAAFPVPPRVWLRAWTATVAVLVLIAALGVTVVATVLGVTTGWAPVWSSLAHAVAGAGIAVWWSTRHPSVCDHGSVRSRPAPMRPTLGFLGVLMVSMSITDSVVAWSGPVAVLGALVLAVVLVRRTETRIERQGWGEVVRGVSG